MIVVLRRISKGYAVYPCIRVWPSLFDCAGGVLSIAISTQAQVETEQWLKSKYALLIIVTTLVVTRSYLLTLFWTSPSFSVFAGRNNYKMDSHHHLAHGNPSTSYLTDEPEYKQSYMDEEESDFNKYPPPQRPPFYQASSAPKPAYGEEEDADYSDSRHALRPTPPVEKETPSWFRRACILFATPPSDLISF